MSSGLDIAYDAAPAAMAKCVKAYVAAEIETTPSPAASTAEFARFCFKAAADCCFTNAFAVLAVHGYGADTYAMSKRELTGSAFVCSCSGSL